MQKALQFPESVVAEQLLKRNNDIRQRMSQLQTQLGLLSQEAQEVHRGLTALCEEWAEKYELPSDERHDFERVGEKLFIVSVPKETESE